MYRSLSVFEIGLYKRLLTADRKGLVAGPTPFRSGRSKQQRSPLSAAYATSTASARPVPPNTRQPLVGTGCQFRSRTVGRSRVQLGTGPAGVTSITKWAQRTSARFAPDDDAAANPGHNDISTRRCGQGSQKSGWGSGGSTLMALAGLRSRESPSPLVYRRPGELWFGSKWPPLAAQEVQSSSPLACA